MAQWVNKDCPQLEKDQINIFRLKASIVSQQINLSRLLKPTERGTMDFRGGSQREIQFVLCSKCETTVSTSACAQLSSQVSSSLQTSSPATQAHKHQRIRCCSLELNCSHFGSWRNVKQARIPVIDTLGGLRRLMLTLMGAKLIRIPLSRLQLVPVVLFEVAAQFRQTRPPSSKLYPVRDCQETAEPFVRVASFEF